MDRIPFAGSFPSPCDVLIIGGGILGSAVAYFLAALDTGSLRVGEGGALLSGGDGEARVPGGLRVVVVERDPTYAQASTTLSVGGIRQQFSTPENILLSAFSARFLRRAPELLTVEGEAPDLGFTEAGYLFLATAKGLSVLERNHALQKALGAEVVLLTPAQLKDRFPWLETQDLAAGSLGLRGEGWLDPYSLLQALKRKARALGVVYLTDEVVAVHTAEGRVLGVTLARQGRMATGTVVNAAGPRAALVAAMAGIGDLPVRPRKRMVYRIRCRDPLPGCPLVVDPSGVYFRPEGDGFLCGVSPPPHRDPDTFDLGVDESLFYEKVWPSLARRVPAFQAVKLMSSWAGLYEFNTLDQNGILGPCPQLPNFFLAAGFSGHGLQQAPAVGLAVAEGILFGEYRTLKVERLGFGRIALGEPLKEENVV